MLKGHTIVMNAELGAALIGVGGVLVGGALSMVSSWVTTRSSTHAAQVESWRETRLQRHQEFIDAFAAFSAEVEELGRSDSRQRDEVIDHPLACQQMVAAKERLRLIAEPLTYRTAHEAAQTMRLSYRYLGSARIRELDVIANGYDPKSVPGIMDVGVSGISLWHDAHDYEHRYVELAYLELLGRPRSNMKYVRARFRRWWKLRKLPEPVRPPKMPT